MYILHLCEAQSMKTFERFQRERPFLQHLRSRWKAVIAHCPAGLSPNRYAGLSPIRKVVLDGTPSEIPTHATSLDRYT